MPKFIKGDRDLLPLDEYVLLTLEEYKELLDKQAKLYALEAAGVDNWEGYEFALEIMEENLA